MLLFFTVFTFKKKLHRPPGGQKRLDYLVESDGFIELGLGLNNAGVPLLIHPLHRQILHRETAVYNIFSPQSFYF